MAIVPGLMAIMKMTGHKISQEAANLISNWNHFRQPRETISSFTRARRPSSGAPRVKCSMQMILRRGEISVLIFALIVVQNKNRGKISARGAFRGRARWRWMVCDDCNVSQIITTAKMVVACTGSSLGQFVSIHPPSSPSVRPTDHHSLRTGVKRAAN